MKLKEKRKIHIQPVKTDTTTHTPPPPSIQISTNITPSDLEEVGFLGSGSQSTVYRVVNRKTGDN